MSANRQVLQNFPRLGTQFVNEDRTLAFPWYRFLITLWQRTGSAFGTNVTPDNAVYFTNTVSGIAVYLVSDNTFLGYLGPTGGGGGPAVPVLVGSSPLVYTAPGPGFVLVSSGKIEISRDSGGLYYVVGLQGGAVPVAMGDFVRVSWIQVPPLVTFFPGVA